VGPDELIPDKRRSVCC